MRIPGEYARHFVANIRVTGFCLVMAVFHAVHAIFPCELTSHEFWGWSVRPGEHASREEAERCSYER